MTVTLSFSMLSKINNHVMNLLLPLNFQNLLNL